MNYPERYLDILIKMFTFSVVTMNAMKRLMSSNSEASILASADDPRGLFVVLRHPKTHEAVLGPQWLDVSPRKTPAEMSVFQESFTKHLFAQLLGM